MISVITPIYKVEKYIARCVRSLMEQTLKDGIEFIFVNDCTPDNSMDILYEVIKEYPERKDQIVVIEHPRNLGVTQSRRDGLAVAKGNYIGWCDSDDWVEPSMFETMLNASNNSVSEIVVCNYFESGINGERIVKHGKNNTPRECIQNCVKSRCAWCLFNQIFQRDLIVRAFEEIVPTNYSEDTFAIWHVYYWAKKISFVDAPLYHYDKSNVNSLVHNVRFSPQSWLEQEENLKKIAKLYYSNNQKIIYHLAVNYFTFTRKYFFFKAFYSPKHFFYTFRECSYDILFFPGMKRKNRIKTFIVNNNYLLFFLLYRKRFQK